MKARGSQIFQVVSLVLFYTICYGNPRAGFFLPDSVTELTIKFQAVRNLIVLPVTLNDSITVNLILDTGCRNLLLFGKKFQELLNAQSGRTIQFSGLGEGQPVNATLSLNNKASIGSIVGHEIPVVVVPQKNIFDGLRNIHGIIGYDIFLKFEIEINSREQTITFRPAASVDPRENFFVVPLDIRDSKPVMPAAEFFGSNDVAKFDVIIDTGSSLGFLLQTTDASVFSNGVKPSVVGRGLNGNITGYQTRLKKMITGKLVIVQPPVAVSESSQGDRASIGMDILKNYIVILNYCKAYACFKPV
ncbi:MAG TPA: pepsin/retropepsin-like aspartic protease family protein [Chryseosolibacter sp.]|nr:pepsin/retropepsin-like aspartic protease family protein [Chryseosolibacter sp.]